MKGKISDNPEKLNLNDFKFEKRYGFNNIKKMKLDIYLKVSL